MRTDLRALMVFQLRRPLVMLVATFAPWPTRRCCGSHCDAARMSAITDFFMPLTYPSARREAWIFLHLSERTTQPSEHMLRRKNVSSAGSNRGSGGVY